MRRPVNTPTRRFVFVLAIFCFTSGCVFLEESETSAIQFIVIGDWGDGGSEAQRRVAESMEVLATKHRIDFVVTTGDNMYPHGVNGVDDPLWNQSFVDVYSSQSLQHLKWYAVLGNHDYHGNYESQIDYQTANLRWRLPSTYYHESWSIDDEVSILIVFTDTNPYVGKYRLRPNKYHGILDQNPAAQTAWLRTTLCDSEATWKVVVGHHPIASDSHHGGAPELMEEWLPIFSECSVDLYLAGHEHHLQLDELIGFHQMISGAGSRLRPVSDTEGSLFKRSVNGFAFVEADVERIRLSFISSDGREVFSHYLGPIL